MVETEEPVGIIIETGCPMTIANCEKYGLTDRQVANFCNKGCSPICGEEFEKQFGKKGVKVDGRK